MLKLKALQVINLQNHRVSLHYSNLVNLWKVKQGQVLKVGIPNRCSICESNCLPVVKCRLVSVVNVLDELGCRHSVMV